MGETARAIALPAKDANILLPTGVISHWRPIDLLVHVCIDVVYRLCYNIHVCGSIGNKRCKG